MYGNHGFRDQRNFAPVRVGEEIDVLIEASGEKGDGICKKKGFVLFVPNTKEGDKVKIRVTKVLRKVGFAEVIGEADESKIERDERPAPAVPNVEPEPVPEDSEDFGEEPAKEEGASEDAAEPEAVEDQADAEVSPEEDQAAEPDKESQDEAAEPDKESQDEAAEPDKESQDEATEPDKGSQETAEPDEEEKKPSDDSKKE